MGGKKKRNRQAAAIAIENQGDILAKQTAAQDQYDSDLAALKGMQSTDFYKDLGYQGYADKVQGVQGTQMGQLATGQVANLGPARGYADQLTQAQGFTTDVAGLARGQDTGLSNVFNNLQVSTAGAEFAANEADQALAASQNLIAQTGGGGATALAAAASKSKAGIQADIDRQVIENEKLRAQGEQGLQRDLLAQGNLASQFDLGQQQFNQSARQQANMFNAQAANQAARFGAESANQFALADFGAQNNMSQFNASASNAQSLADFQNRANVNAQNATATNAALSQDAKSTAAMDLAKAAGATDAERGAYNIQANLLDISTNALSEQDAVAAENQAVIDLGKMSKRNIFG
tara:strand:+ start:4593 stop:5642 length:1050 start_codon:yes stop_codon:yes gene_type:complete